MAEIWATLAAAVVGAGATVYSANQASKGSGQSRSASELSGLPYAQQLKFSKAQAEQQLALNRQHLDQAMEYAPKLAIAQRRANTQLLKGVPAFAAAERAASSAQRGGDLADLQRFGGDYASALGGLSSAYRGIDAEMQRGQGSELLDYLNDEALYGPIGQELQSQALEGLRLRGQLSPEEERMVAQQTRAAYGARGLNYSNPAIGAEFLNRDTFARGRENDRRQFAIQTDQLALQRGLGTQAANEASQGNWRNFLISGSQAQLQPAMSYLQGRSAASPMAYLGMNVGNPGTTSYGALSSTAPSIAQGAQSLTPLYNYANNVYGTNFAAGESRANAQANAYGAVGAGLLSTAGDIYTANKKYGQ